MEKKILRSVAQSKSIESKKEVGSVRKNQWRDHGSTKRRESSLPVSSKSDSRKAPSHLYPGPVSIRNDRTKSKARDVSVTDANGAGAGLSPDLTEDELQHKTKNENFNSLLNFQYAPRELYNSGGDIRKRKIFVARSNFKKEHYLQANCQFILKSVEKQIEWNDPDLLVNWNSIEQINAHVTEPACPICLYPPIAAKMTRCGHVYCWPCVLHYLALSDKKWRHCPICNEHVTREDLKSVIFIPPMAFSINDVVIMKLMKRERDSLIVYAAENKKEIEESSAAVIRNMTYARQNGVQAKILTATNNDLESIIEREERQLRVQYSELKNDSSPEVCFIQEALNALEQRQICNVAQLSIIEDKGLDVTIKQPVDQTKNYFFYQAENGQHTYLHAINSKMIESEYGHMEFAPQTLVGRIIEIECITITDQLRNRVRYLKHLPISTQVEFVEIAFERNFISKEIQFNFQGQLNSRAKTRKQRKRIEKIHDDRIRSEQLRDPFTSFDINGHTGEDKNLQIESIEQFPEFGLNKIDETPCCSNAIQISSPIDSGSTSFAKMLTSPSNKVVTRRIEKPFEENVKEEDIYANGYSYEFNLLEAIEASDTALKNESSKKKKKKHRLLFATSMNYQDN